VENNVSFRAHEKGSLFTEALCRVLNENAHLSHVELNSLLLEVNNQMAMDPSGQMPQILNQLRRQFYFNFDKSKPIVLAKSFNSNDVSGVASSGSCSSSLLLSTIKTSDEREKRDALKWLGDGKFLQLDNFLLSANNYSDSVREVSITDAFMRSSIEANTFKKLRRSLEKLVLENKKKLSKSTRWHSTVLCLLKSWTCLRTRSNLFGQTRSAN
jgi:hypothetical protein